MNMRSAARYSYLLAFAIAFILLGGVSWAYHVHGQAPRKSDAGKAAPADTLVINTTELAKDVIGYQGTTPLEIKLVEGRIVAIEALPNSETPGFFRRVRSSALFSAPLGKTPAEVLAMPLDAVSGATYSSEAVIENLRRGLQSVAQ